MTHNYKESPRPILYQPTLPIENPPSSKTSVAEVQSVQFDFQYFTNICSVIKFNIFTVSFVSSELLLQVHDLNNTFHDHIVFVSSISLLAHHSVTLFTSNIIS
jgi:hypothetical protein